MTSNPGTLSKWTAWTEYSGLSATSRTTGFKGTKPGFGYSPNETFSCSRKWAERLAHCSPDWGGTKKKSVSFRVRRRLPPTGPAALPGACPRRPDEIPNKNSAPNTQELIHFCPANLKPLMFIPHQSPYLLLPSEIKGRDSFGQTSPKPPETGRQPIYPKPTPNPNSTMAKENSPVVSGSDLGLRATD